MKLDTSTTRQIALGSGAVLGGLALLIVTLVYVRGLQPAEEPIAFFSPTPSTSATLALSPSASPSLSPSPPPSATATPATATPATATPATATPASTPTANPTASPSATAQPTATPAPTASPPSSLPSWTRTALLADEDSEFSKALRAALGYAEDAWDYMYWGYPALAVDAAGNAHVTWASGGAGLGAIHYVTNAGGSWSLTEVTTPRAGSWDEDRAIAVDDVGTVVIAFLRIDNPDDWSGTAYLATNGGGDWSEPIEIPYPYDVYQRGSLAVRDGIVHLAYATVDGLSHESRVWHVTYANGTWTSNLVATVPDVVAHLVVDLSSASEMRLAFNVGPGLRVATRGSEGGPFVVRDTPHGPFDLQYHGTLLALAGDGSLHVISGNQYALLREGRWSNAQHVFPRVSWFDGCGYRLSRGRPLPFALRVGPDGSAHVVSHLDGPYRAVAWYANNLGGDFSALKLHQPGRAYAPDERLRETVEGCLRNVAIDIFDPVGLDIAIDARGRPHVFTAHLNYLDYFIGPAD